MNHLNFDATSNPQYANNNNNNYMPAQTGFGFNNIQTLLQFELLGKLRTGNGLYDAIIGYIVFTFVTIGLTRGLGMLASFKDLLVRYTSLFFEKTYGYMFRLFYTRRYSKTVEISYITDNKQINELYKAVYWYLSNTQEVDYVHETPLKFTYENKAERLHPSISDIKVNKHIVYNKTKDITYKKQNITYFYNTEVLTIYSDRDRKRENYKITLSTLIDDFTTNDIIEDFCAFCIYEYAKSNGANKWTQQIFINEGSKWTSQPSNNHRKLDTVILKNNLKNDIKNDAQLFLNSEEWYKHRDIGYTRGYLFYGYPGTVKTSVIKGLSLQLKRHIHYLMLNNITSDTELLELLKLVNYKETILVIEDVDCMSEIVKKRLPVEDSNDKKRRQREQEKDRADKRAKDDKKSNNLNVYGIDKVETDKSKFTLSGLLNAIDGVFNNDGRILIMTTNHPEVLDGALIRPGRVDRKFLFDNCNKAQIRDLYQMFFERQCSSDQLAGIKEQEYSPAHITSIFLRFRDHPDEALKHLDDVEDRPVIEPLFKSSTDKDRTDDIVEKKLYTSEPLIDDVMHGEIVCPEWTEYSNGISTAKDDIKLNFLNI